MPGLNRISGVRNQGATSLFGNSGKSTLLIIHFREWDITDKETIQNPLFCHTKESRLKIQHSQLWIGAATSAKLWASWMCISSCWDGGRDQLIKAIYRKVKKVTQERSFTVHWILS